MEDQKQTNWWLVLFALVGLAFMSVGGLVAGVLEVNGSAEIAVVGG